MLGLHCDVEKSLEYSVDCQRSRNVSLGVSNIKMISDILERFERCILRTSESNNCTKINSTRNYTNTCSSTNNSFLIFKACNTSQYHIIVDSNNSLSYPWGINLKLKRKLSVKNTTQQFPIYEFMKMFLPINTTTNLQPLLCQNTSETCCNCDDDCMRSRSCCIDKLWNQSKPMILESYLDMFIKQSRKYKKVVCKPIFQHKRFIKVDHILMVTSCLKGATNNQKALCRSHSALEYSLPILGIDNYVYMNKHCARCNFITQFRPINITAHCNFASRPKLPLKESRHNIQHFLRKCSNIKVKPNKFISPLP